METFDCLPVAATVNGIYLTMHGGISQRLTNLNVINQFERRMEPDDSSLLSDLLWADPAPTKTCDRIQFKENKERGISCYFGKTPLIALLK